MNYNYASTRKLKGFITTGYYTDEEYRAFTKQVLKKLDEYFISDCSFDIGIGSRIKAKVDVICSSNGNRYRISYDEDMLDICCQSQAEFEHHLYVRVLDSLHEDINYLKESVGKIIDAARTGNPLERKEADSENNDNDD